MLKLITLMIILGSCSTTSNIVPERCPRVVFYNNSGLPFVPVDTKYANQASENCDRKYKDLPCALWMVKRGNISYHIQCGLMPRYDGLDPIFIKHNHKTRL